MRRGRGKKAVGGGGEGRPVHPNPPVSLRESSLNHAQSHNSQPEFTRGFLCHQFSYP